MPNGQYFGGAPNAFAGGMEFNSYRRDQRKRENALNALIQRFGPEAASPQALSSLVATEQGEKMFPHQLGAMERHTAGQVENVRRFGAPAGDPTSQASQEEEQQRRRTVAIGLVQSLKVARSNEVDMGAAFDRYAGALSTMGYPPEQLMAMREEIVQNPGALEELEAGLMGMQQGSADAPRVVSTVEMIGDDGKMERHLVMSNGVTVPMEGESAGAALSRERNEQGWERLSDADIKRDYPAAQPGVQYWRDPGTGRVYADAVPGSPQEQEQRAAEGEAASAARTAIGVATGILEQNQTVVRHGDRAMQLASKISGRGVLSANARLAMSKIPGTDMFELNRDIQSVKDNIGINELLRIKASGSGLGQVPQQQLITLQSVLGRLEIQRDPTNLREDLSNVIRIFGAIAERSQGDIEAAQEMLRSQGVERGTSFGPQPRLAPTTGLSATDRAAQLLAEGLSDAEIVARLRAEGLIK